jgi:DNA-binding NarL/FixJ family response regulator
MSVQATTSPTARSVDPPEARATDVQVLIVDNERLLAEALEVVLVAEGIKIGAITSPGPDLLDDVRRRRPDVVILGVDAPSDADVRRGETIVDACGTTRVLLVASNVDRATMVRVSRAGLHCIPKHASVAELIRTVRSLADGGVPARD